MRYLMFTLLLTILGCSFEQTKSETKSLEFEGYKIDMTGENSSDLTISDLKSDSVLMVISKIDCKEIIFYNLDGRLIYQCSKTELKEIWEIEAELDLIMQLDLTDKDLEGVEVLGTFNFQTGIINEDT